MLFNLKERLQSLRMLKGLGQFLQHPDDLQSVYAVAASVQGSPLAAQMMRHMLSEPGIAAMIQEQWRPAAIDLDALEQLPAGSLGQCYDFAASEQGKTYQRDNHTLGIGFSRQDDFTLVVFWEDPRQQ